MVAEVHWEGKQMVNTGDMDSKALITLLGSSSKGIGLVSSD